MNIKRFNESSDSNDSDISIEELYKLVENKSINIIVNGNDKPTANDIDNLLGEIEVFEELENHENFPEMVIEELDRPKSKYTDHFSKIGYHLILITRNNKPHFVIYDHNNGILNYTSFKGVSIITSTNGFMVVYQDGDYKVDNIG